MSTYVIALVNVKDTEKWQQYAGTVPQTFKEHGGELVFKGEKTSVLAGEHPYSIAVVLKFPDQQSVQNWYNSDAYQNLIPLRNEAADVVFVSYQGQ